MSSRKKETKFYVVWAGRETGVFDSWEACRAAVHGFEGARYKSFPDRQLAEDAFHKGKPDRVLKLPSREGVILNSISVDAACSGAGGQMEYQGVYTDGGQRLFHQGPFPGGTNNIGEFLAIVHALAWCKKHRTDLPVYTDSKTALAWVRKKKANTKAIENQKNKYLFELLQRAETWLENNHWDNPVLKWNTEAWGEIPADFGRK